MLFRADPWLHVIAGCMSSGKTDEMLRLLRRAEIARRRILLVRPDVDDRTPAEYAESRSKARYPSVLVPRNEPVRILSLARERDVDLIGIEEAQFFGPELPAIIEEIVGAPRTVIVSGLDQDFAGRPFATIPELMARADEVTKLSAICVVCGNEATRTQRLRGGKPARADDELIVIGGMAGDDTYEARCRACHEVIA